MTSLCLDCGLCCDGTMHSTVALQRGDDRGVLERSGFHLLVYEDEARFEQPCRAFDSTCTIYDDRPSMCRSYRCTVLRQVDSGEMTDDAARELVSAAIELRDRVRPAIESLVGSTKRHSLAVLVRKMEDALDAMDPQVRDSTQADLERDAAALLQLLADHFEPHGASTAAPESTATSETSASSASSASSETVQSSARADLQS